MNVRTRFRVAVLLSGLTVAGCGTVTNLCVAPPEEGGKTPFGGVKQDMAGIHKAAHGEADGPGHNGQVAPALFYAADLPFSAVGDVLLWPYTAAYSYINQPTPVPPLNAAPPLPGTQGKVEIRPSTAAPESLPPPKSVP